MTNVLEKEFYHFERNVGEGISIHYMDAYLKFFFRLSCPPPQLEILGPSLDPSMCNGEQGGIPYNKRTYE